MKRLLDRCVLLAALLCASTGLGGIGRAEQPAPFQDCPDNTWTATSTIGAPLGREFHSAVWTGSEMIVWGGFNFDTHAVNTGARYNPAGDSWLATSLTNAPAPRSYHSAVWTGAEMIVWGGGASGLLNTGGRYDPINNIWTSTSTVGAPAPRNQHTAIWTGSEMIVWGGVGCGGNCWFNTGGRYNPTTDTWTPMSTVNAPEARWKQSALWTGTEMIVWGGTNQSNYLATGGRYNPATDTWTPTSYSVNSPVGRIAHSAVWTGSEMIVWGGVADGTFAVTNTGGRYSPVTDTWVATSLVSTPQARADPAWVWTGHEKIVWGGNYTGGDLGDGARYNPASDTWTPTAATNAPLARTYHLGVWTGNEMILWGGLNGDSGTFPTTGARYCAQPTTPLVQSAVSRKAHGTMGNFDIDLPLSGAPALECRSGGAAGDYTLVVTFLANVSVQGNPQAAITAGEGTIGRNGISNNGSVVIAGNVVTIPLTSVANAQTINVTLNNVNGSPNVMIPMRVLIGDLNGNGVVNSSDIGLVKACSGQPVGPSTFRCDVNADGNISASDISFVKSLAGTVLP